MPVTRGKLNKPDQSKIDQNFSYLLEHLDASDLGDLLIERGIFDSDDSELIRMQPSTPKGRNRNLLEILSNAGPLAYEVFREILLKDYGFIVAKLDATVPVITDDRSEGQKLKDELTDDQRKHQLKEDVAYFSKAFSTAITLVAAGLGIDKTGVEQIQLSNQFGGAVTHNHTLLIKWKNRTGSAATLLALMEAFIRAEEMGGEMNWKHVEDGIKQITK